MLKPKKNLRILANVYNNSVKTLGITSIKMLRSLWSSSLCNAQKLRQSNKFFPFFHANSSLFSDNPLKCDCLMKWVITDKPESLRGKCEMPKDKQGKNLKDLELEDFHCHLM
ncbi:hypothetical protein CEXT_349221 [Caerostris extrusa]|uniref:Uncharacterized protein n=1 Tax=Caerostris extrusa TaxID=172846 RepID=A0AAV4P9Z2_CAEEX|nr:hypothetical protein CEXT_349221 [Caerostris extrusa]